MAEELNLGMMISIVNKYLSDNEIAHEDFQISTSFAFVASLKLPLDGLTTPKGAISFVINEGRMHWDGMAKDDHRNYKNDSRMYFSFTDPPAENTAQKQRIMIEKAFKTEKEFRDMLPKMLHVAEVTPTDKKLRNIEIKINNLKNKVDQILDILTEQSVVQPPVVEEAASRPRRLLQLPRRTIDPGPAVEL
jgi:hypothetical protein